MGLWGGRWGGGIHAHHAPTVSQLAPGEVLQAQDLFLPWNCPSVGYWYTHLPDKEVAQRSQVTCPRSPTKEMGERWGANPVLPNSQAQALFPALPRQLHWWVPDQWPFTETDQTPKRRAHASFGGTWSWLWAGHQTVFIPPSPQPQPSEQLNHSGLLSQLKS